MVVQGVDDEGNEIAIFDPSGVYLMGSEKQAEFRIFGQQRLKTFGFNLQQKPDEEGGDILSYQGGLKNIPLQTNDGILTLRTLNKRLTSDQRKFITNEIDEILEGEEGRDYCLVLETTSLLMNEAHLTKKEAQRLKHWRIGHRVEAKSTLNEDCPVCAEGKKKIGTYKRNYEFQGNTKGVLQPYWRLYCDGYGGQHSMGDMSYQGGIGGYVFACPSGAIKTKLYGSTEQFPSILFQVLQEIETEGYVTREIYVDTHSVNLSRAAEEVACMFRVKIIPVSAGPIYLSSAGELQTYMQHIFISFWFKPNMGAALMNIGRGLNLTWIVSLSKSSVRPASTVRWKVQNTNEDLKQNGVGF